MLEISSDPAITDFSILRFYLEPDGRRWFASGSHIQVSLTEMHAKGAELVRERFAVASQTRMTEMEAQRNSVAPRVLETMRKNRRVVWVTLVDDLLAIKAIDTSKGWAVDTPERIAWPVNCDELFEALRRTLLKAPVESRT